MPDRIAEHVEHVRCLSPRELEVLDIVALGLTNAEIGQELDLTVHAVTFHLGGVCRKLEVGNRTEAAAVYLRASSAVGATPPRKDSSD